MVELGNWLFGNARGDFEVPRAWNEEFVKFLNVLGLDSYGLPGFVNATFEVFPWGDCTCDRLLLEPNFLFKPTGFEIQWYKYPFGSSYMNQHICKADFIDILRECAESFNFKDDF